MIKNVPIESLNVRTSNTPPATTIAAEPDRVFDVADASVPWFTFTVPPNVVAPDRASVPVPVFVRVPEPLMPPANVPLVAVFTVSVLPPSAMPPPVPVSPASVVGAPRATVPPIIVMLVTLLPSAAASASVSVPAATFITVPSEMLPAAPRSVRPPEPDFVSVRATPPSERPPSVSSAPEPVVKLAFPESVVAPNAMPAVPLVTVAPRPIVSTEEPIESVPSVCVMPAVPVARLERIVASAVTPVA